MCVTATDLRVCGRGRVTRLKIQYPSAIRRPITPMMGRMTNGGFIITSRPLTVAATGVGLGEPLGLDVGEGEVSGDGDALGDGEGDAVAAWRLKLAQGFGSTLAHSL